MWQPTSPEEKLIARGAFPTFSNILVLPDEAAPSLIVAPQGSEERPISGRIVAIGWEVDPEKYRLGQRVVFSTHAGAEWCVSEGERNEEDKIQKVPGGLSVVAYLMSCGEVEMLIDDDGPLWEAK